MEKLEKLSEEDLLKLYNENKQKVNELLDKKEELKKELTRKGD